MVYILFLWFYIGGGDKWIGINLLGSMRRGRGKKGGEEESKALKSKHGKLKTMERELGLLWKLKWKLWNR